MGLVMDRWQRLFVGAILPALFLGLTVVPYLLVRGDLPGPIAIHFGGDGRADGSGPLWLHLTVVSLFTVTASAVLLWSAWRPRSTVGVEAAVATFVGWLIGFVNAIVLFANEGVEQWREARLGGSGAIWGATLSALVVAVPVARMVRHAADGRSGEPAPALELGGAERAAWFGRANSRVIASGVVFLIFVGTVVLLAFAGGGLATGLVLLATGLAMVSFMSLDVAVGETGVRVRAGALRWPTVHFGLDEIEAARSVHWDPLRGGLVSGWGYRGSLRLMGRAGWVLRGGPALELDLTDGRRFVVTVDGAEEAAAVLNGLLARRRPNR